MDYPQCIIAQYKHFFLDISGCHVKDKENLLGISASRKHIRVEQGGFLFTNLSPHLFLFFFFTD